MSGHTPVGVENVRGQFRRSTAKLRFMVAARRSKPIGRQARRIPVGSGLESAARSHDLHHVIFPRLKPFLDDPQHLALRHLSASQGLLQCAQLPPPRPRLAQLLPQP